MNNVLSEKQRYSEHLRMIDEEEFEKVVYDKNLCPSIVNSEAEHCPRCWE
jgi:hypothetical protein